MTKYDFSLQSPLVNAAGSLGFAPDRRSDIGKALSAFITNPTSLSPRTPAHGRRFMAFPGGFLLHTGYPNPGLNSLVRRYSSHWMRAGIPVWVHLLSEHPEEVSNMARQLESVEGVAGIELGLPPGAEPKVASALAAAAVGELPVIVRLPFGLAVNLAAFLSDLPISAFSLGPPRGSLLGPEGLLHGRLYGPAIFPLALATVEKLVRFGVPIIGAGGVYSQRDIEAMLAAGATGVQLDAVLWRGGLPGLA